MSISTTLVLSTAGTSTNHSELREFLDTYTQDSDILETTTDTVLAPTVSLQRHNNHYEAFAEILNQLTSTALEFSHAAIVTYNDTNDRSTVSVFEPTPHGCTIIDDTTLEYAHGRFPEPGNYLRNVHHLDADILI